MKKRVNKYLKRSWTLFCTLLCVLTSIFAFLPTSNAASSLRKENICNDGTTSTSCNGYVTHQMKSDEGWYETHIYYVDGEVAYCLEPRKFSSSSASDYTAQSWETSGFSFTEEQIYQLELIAYFGYGYDGHDSVLWYLATQKLIWEIVDSSLDVSFKYSTGNTIDLTKYTNEIFDLIDEFETKPSFAEQTFKEKINGEITLTDTNGVLSNWEVTTDSSSCSVTTSGNNLTISCEEVQEVTLNLSRKEISTDVSVIYEGAGDYQSLGVLHFNTPITAATQVNFIEISYPEITKEVSKAEVEIGEEFTYSFQYEIEQLEEGIYYSSFLIEDEFESVLKLEDSEQVKIYNESGEDVTDLYVISINNNKLEITVQDLENDEFYGHTYTVEVTTEILSTANLTEYEEDGVYIIPNEVFLTVDDNITSDYAEITTEVPVVEVPNTFSQISTALFAGGISGCVVGIGGYYLVFKKRII